MALTPGTFLNNRYRITEVLGQGGMGAVYRAQDTNLNIEVAVKENQFLSDEYGRQFKREASILAGLRQPNLPHVIDYFTIPNQGQYLIMDFIEGEDLRQRIERNGVLPEQDVAIMGALICDALEYLHTRKPAVIHRDIKPGNIKITPEGQIVLVDFGLVKLMKDGQETESGARAMTPGYSPPEQYGTSRTDRRSDIYSLGATLYAALTGTIPEDGFARITGKADLTALRKIRPGVNQVLAQVIEKSLALEPSERYHSAAQFRSALLKASELTETAPKRMGVQPPPSDPLASQIDTPIRKPITSGLALNSNRKLSKNKGWYLLFSIFFLILAACSAYLLSNHNYYSSHRQIPQSQEIIDSIVSASASPNPVLIPSLTTSPSPQATQRIASTHISSPIPSETIVSTSTAFAFIPIEMTPVGGGSGEIAFASNRTGIMQIWLMDSLGENQVQLTNLPDGACQPSWSPDGSQIVFTSPCAGKRETYPGSRLYILTLNSLAVEPLPLPSGSAGDFDPAWFPQGNAIAFTSLRSGYRQIWLYIIDTDQLIRLSVGSEDDFQPAWSPDGRQIAFVHVPSYQQIWLMNADGSNQHQFTLSGPVNDFLPTWSPDGQTILFNQSSSNTFLPYLMGLHIQDAFSYHEFRINPARSEISPIAEVQYSPDGLWLTFESWPDGSNHDIYRMTANGNGNTRLTDDPSFDFGAVWRPLLLSR